MKNINLAVGVVLSLFTASLCQADTLVITYRSGKTQTITLDEPSTTINSWQFVGSVSSTVPQQPQQQTTSQEQTKAAPNKADAKTTDKPDDKKSNIRFKWNAPPVRE